MEQAREAMKELEKSGNPDPVTPIIPRQELDAVAIRARWERSQKDLDREKQSRLVESTQTAARIEALNHKLRVTAEALETAKAKSSRAGRPKLPLLILGCVVFSLGAGVAVYWTVTRPANRPAAATASPPPRPDSTDRPRAFQPSPVPRGLFSSAASRLSSALAAFPDRSGEEIFRELNAQSAKDGPVCPMEWNSDQPAVVFASAPSVNAALTRCAEAVERLRR